METQEAPNTPEAVIQTGDPAMTVTAPVTPEEGEGEQLLAGKFKDQGELEKAYLELQSKLGQQSQQPAEEAAEETPEGETKEAEAKETKEGEEASESPYGEAVTEALNTAGLNPTEVAEEFNTNGEISDATYEALEKAGYPREMVDAYKRGIEATNATTTEVTEAQITEIKAIAGGDQGFAELQQWMAANVDAAGLEAYNAALATGDAAKITAQVKAMADARQEALGSEGKLLGGKSPTEAPGYASEAAMLEDMAKPEYKTSATFRAQVEAKIAKSPNLMVTR